MQITTTTSNLRAANTYSSHIRVGVGAIPMSVDLKFEASIHSNRERTSVGARLPGIFLAVGWQDLFDFIRRPLLPCEHNVPAGWLVVRLCFE
jgi:hypothetical protein